MIENVKRVKAVRLEPGPNGITIIGGANGQGKTSILDAIAWTLGGAKLAPSNASRDGAMNPAATRLTLSNGIVVERRGKNGTLHVTDPSGQKAGQSLLDSFVSQFALDLPAFMNANSKEKAQTLLRILGIGDQLAQLDLDEKRVYNERHAIGQIADAKAKHAQEMPEYPDAPHEPVSVSDLIRRQQTLLAQNGENQRLRDRRDALEKDVARMRTELAELKRKLDTAETELATAQKSAEQLRDESTAEIEAQIQDFESINSQVSANLAKAAAMDEAAQHKAQYEALSAKLDELRQSRLLLLEGADLPLPDLSITEGELVYRAQPWDGMAHSEQLRVAVAIVRKLNPECGFVLLDKLEAMDMQTLQAFADWCESEQLQVIATRVSTGQECTIIIEDGLPQGETFLEVKTGIKAEEETANQWGSF